MSSSKTDWKSPPGALELISSLGPEHQNYPPSLEAQLLMVVWNESDPSQMYPGSDETDSTDSIMHEF